MKIAGKLLLVAGLVLVASVNASAAPKKLSLKTSSFTPGGELPAQYSCDTELLSNTPFPRITWKKPASTVKSYALIVSDPDAPGGTFYHMGAYNLKGTLTGIKVSEVIKMYNWDMAVNSTGSQSYLPPCAPEGQTHRYVFSVYALSVKPSVKNGTTVSSLVKRLEKGDLKKKVIAKGSVLWNPRGCTCSVQALREPAISFTRYPFNT